MAGMAITRYFDHDGPIPLAHRGFSLDGHENTMAAFEAAVDLGYRHLETDVHVTSDGELVAFHDESLDRVTDRTGLIRELPWLEVRKARIGEHSVPLLDEVLDTWPQVCLNIDCKHESAAAALAEVIERHAAHDRVLVASFSDDTRRDVLSRLSAPVATSGGTTMTRDAVLGSLLRLSPLARRGLRDVDALQVPVQHGKIPVVTPQLLRNAHRHDVQVHVWTINQTEEMHRLLDLGVDGIVTDRADLLKQVLQQRGQWEQG